MLQLGGFLLAAPLTTGAFLLSGGRVEEDWPREGSVIGAGGGVKMSSPSSAAVSRLFSMASWSCSKVLSTGIRLGRSRLQGCLFHPLQTHPVLLPHQQLHKLPLYKMAPNGTSGPKTRSSKSNNLCIADLVRQQLITLRASLQRATTFDSIISASSICLVA